jgi:hypothetical protein
MSFFKCCICYAINKWYLCFYLSVTSFFIVQRFAPINSMLNDRCSWNPIKCLSLRLYLLKYQFKCLIDIDRVVFQSKLLFKYEQVIAVYVLSVYAEVPTCCMKWYQISSEYRQLIFILQRTKVCYLVFFCLKINLSIHLLTSKFENHGYSIF